MRLPRAGFKPAPTRADTRVRPYVSVINLEVFMNLNLGCGMDRREGAINVDKIRTPAVDQVWDLDLTPWPWPEKSFEIVYAQDIIEHLDDVVCVMEEIHRILKPGGVLIIRTSYWQTENSFTDPTHKHYFTLKSFDFFEPDTFFGGKYGYYSDAKFKVGKREIQGQELYFELIKI